MAIFCLRPEDYTGILTRFARNGRKTDRSEPKPRKPRAQRALGCGVWASGCRGSEPRPGRQPWPRAQEPTNPRYPGPPYPYRVPPGTHPTGYPPRYPTPATLRCTHCPYTVARMLARRCRADILADLYFPCHPPQYTRVFLPILPEMAQNASKPGKTGFFGHFTKIRFD